MRASVVALPAAALGTCSVVPSAGALAVASTTNTLYTITITKHARTGRARAAPTTEITTNVRVRFQIIGNACIEYVGKSQSCMVSKLRIIWKQTVDLVAVAVGRGRHPALMSVPLSRKMAEGTLLVWLVSQ